MCYPFQQVKENQYFTKHLSVSLSYESFFCVAKSIQHVHALSGRAQYWSKMSIFQSSLSELYNFLYLCTELEVVKISFYLTLVVKLRVIFLEGLSLIIVFWAALSFVRFLKSTVLWCYKINIIVFTSFVLLISKAVRNPTEHDVKQWTLVNALGIDIAAIIILWPFRSYYSDNQSYRPYTSRL